MKTSKTKTFNKGDDYGELMDFVMEHVDSIDYIPEETSGVLEPCDPVCELDAKYIITITKVSTLDREKQD